MLDESSLLIEKNRNKKRIEERDAPTLEAIEAYCRERKNSVDPQRFFDYYTANGWMIGCNGIRDWRAVVRRWETNGYDATRANEISDRVGDPSKMFEIIKEE